MLNSMDIETIATINNKAGEVVKNLLESNMPLILLDLGKQLKDSDENAAAIPVKMKLVISHENGKVKLDPTIEWERKKVTKDEGIPVTILVNQPELFEADS